MNKAFSHMALLIFLVVLALGNKSFSQKILIIENRKTLKNIKYVQGSEIRLELGFEDVRVWDQIDDMTDSSLILSNYKEIGFTEIRYVVRDRWFIRILSNFSMIGGAAYFGIDSFNRLINSEWPMVDSQTLAISSGLVASGFVLLPFRYKKIHIGEKWKLRVIDPGAL